MSETTTQTDLAALLREWEEHEPERCKQEDGVWYVHRWGTWRRVTLIGRMDEDRIQAAVQEAVRGRGWFLQTGNLVGGAEARLWTSAREWAAENEPARLVTGPNEGTVALVAYVGALRAQAEGEDG